VYHACILDECRYAVKIEVLYKDQLENDTYEYEVGLIAAHLGVGPQIYEKPWVCDVYLEGKLVPDQAARFHVMEELDISLSKWLNKSLLKNEIPKDVSRVMDLVVHKLELMAQNKIAHNDLHGGNIMLKYEDNSTQVKDAFVIDYGIASAPGTSKKAYNNKVTGWSGKPPARFESSWDRLTLIKAMFDHSHHEIINYLLPPLVESLRRDPFVESVNTRLEPDFDGELRFTIHLRAKDKWEYTTSTTNTEGFRSPTKSKKKVTFEEKQPESPIVSPEAQNLQIRLNALREREENPPPDTTARPRIDPNLRPLEGLPFTTEQIQRDYAQDIDSWKRRIEKSKKNPLYVPIPKGRTLEQWVESVKRNVEDMETKQIDPQFINEYNRIANTILGIAKKAIKRNEQKIPLPPVNPPAPSKRKFLPVPPSQHDPEHEKKMLTSIMEEEIQAAKEKLKKRKFIEPENIESTRLEDKGVVNDAWEMNIDKNIIKEYAEVTSELINKSIDHAQDVAPPNEPPPYEPVYDDTEIPTVSPPRDVI